MRSPADASVNWSITLLRDDSQQHAEKGPAQPRAKVCLIGSASVLEISQITAGISRYFQLVVALEAVVVGPNNSKVEVPLFCLATERIIVRVRRAIFWGKN